MINSEAEIVRSYTKAEHKSRQIRALADLNETTPDSIVEILKRNNCDLRGIRSNIINVPVKKEKIKVSDQEFYDAFRELENEKAAAPKTPECKSIINKDFDAAVNEMIDEDKKKEEKKAAEQTVNLKEAAQIMLVPDSVIECVNAKILQLNNEISDLAENIAKLRKERDDMKRWLGEIDGKRKSEGY